jgi:hypothetical protein
MIFLCGFFHALLFIIWKLYKLNSKNLLWTYLMWWRKEIRIYQGINVWWQNYTRRKVWKSKEIQGIWLASTGMTNTRTSPTTCVILLGALQCGQRRHRRRGALTPTRPSSGSELYSMGSLEDLVRYHLGLPYPTTLRPAYSHPLPA